MSRRTGIATLLASAALVLVAFAPAAQAARDFPRSFLWGTASAGFHAGDQPSPAWVAEMSACVKSW